MPNDLEVDEMTDSAERSRREDSRCLAKLVSDLKAGRASVAFLPVFGCDWQPLFRLSHLCSVFIYCDWRTKQGDWDREFATIFKKLTPVGDGLQRWQVADPEMMYQRLAEQVGQLASMEQPLWPPGNPHEPPPPAWGRLAKLRRDFGGKPRPVWLLHVTGSPIFACRKLFVRLGARLRCLCLRRPDGMDDPLWQLFGDGDGMISQILDAQEGRMPELLVTDHRPHGWPHVYTWQELPALDVRPRLTVYSRPRMPWPEIKPTGNTGPRRVIVTQRRLTPEFAQRFDAVVLTSNQFRRYRWPKGVTVILDAPADYNDPMIISVHQLRWLPLREALRVIEDICRERGLQRVVVSKLGYEDEGAYLPVWSRTCGQITDLTLCLESDGDFLAAAQVADQID